MKMIPNRKGMELAVREARKNFRTVEGGPFGACIVKDGRIVAVARNTVLRGDATAHAEINAIRKACRKLGTHDLSGGIIYSTTEPCPMCFSAIHWAKIARIVYGSGIQDAQRAGFSELTVSNLDMKSAGNSPVEVQGHFMRNEALPLFEIWKTRADKRVY